MLDEGQANHLQSVFHLQRGHIKAQHVADKEKCHDEFVASGLDDHKIAGPEEIVKDDSLKGGVGADKGQYGEISQEDGEVVDHHLLFDFDVFVLFVLGHEIFESGV